jgi:hypothetical protein
MRDGPTAGMVRGIEARGVDVPSYQSPGESGQRYVYEGEQG